MIIMKSPFTGKEMKRVYEKRTWNFRGEQYEYEHISWLCEDSGEQFTNDESDTAGFVQVYDLKGSYQHSRPGVRQ